MSTKILQLNPYADQSDEEYSLHCMTKEDLALLKEAIHLLWSEYPVVNPETKPQRNRLVKLNRAIDECL